jgi:dihydrodiol dehydrogenase / D-xylose 1-dehydrogenase (NADP)
MVSLARAKKLFLMEALWTRFIPSFKFAIEQIRAGIIGDVLHVSATFGVQNLANVERLAKRELGGGTILDLGVYVINIAEMVYEDEPPLKIKAVGKLNEDGVDVSMSAVVLYKGDKTAAIGTNGIVQLPNDYYICGTNGTIRVFQNNLTKDNF